MTSIFYVLYGFAHQSVHFDKVIVFFAESFPYIVLFLALVFLVMHHEILKAEEPSIVLMEKKKEFLSLFYSVAGAYIAAFILKLLFHTLRPFAALPDVH